MRKTLLSLTFASFCCACFSISALAQDLIEEKNLETKVEVTESALTIGSTFTLQSTTFETEREVNVWTPPSYTEGEKKYPVLYIIDGGVDQDFHHISGLAQLATINASIQEMIVVGIRTENRVEELCSEQKDPRYIKGSTNVGNSDRFLKYITDEVIPFVEGKYRIGERRAVIGESLAGLFIAEVFLENPNTFTDYISISPSLWWDDKALARAATELIAAHDKSPRQLYLTMADEGGTMQRGLDMVLEAINANKPAGLEMFYVDRSKTEDHSTIYHPAAHDALQKMFGLPRPEYGDPPWYLVEGGQPEDDQ